MRSGGKRSAHVTTMADPNYSQLINGLALQYSKWDNTSNDINTIFCETWQGDAAKTAEVYRGLIKNMPYSANYMLVQGTAWQPPYYVGQAYDLASTFTPYINGGVKLLPNASAYTLSYYSDNEGFVGTALAGKPTTPGTYWVQARLPSGTYNLEGGDTSRSTATNRGVSQFALKSILGPVSEITKASDGQPLQVPELVLDWQGAGYTGADDLAISLSWHTDDGTMMGESGLYGQNAPLGPSEEGSYQLRLHIVNRNGAAYDETIVLAATISHAQGNLDDTGNPDDTGDQGDTSTPDTNSGNNTRPSVPQYDTADDNTALDEAAAEEAIVPEGESITPEHHDPLASLTITIEDIQDVSMDDWYYEAVDYVVQKHCFVGNGEGLFMPETKMTRGMLVTVLWRVADKPELEGDSFSDVSDAHYYSMASKWAAAEGIVFGYNDGSFGGEDLVTREQLAVILFRFAQMMELDTTPRAELSGYTDASQLSVWAEDAMAWAVGAGLFQGRPDGTLAGNADATRAEAAALIQRFAEMFA